MDLLEDKPPLHTGYLNKEGKSLLVKRWQPRFFALYENKMVISYAVPPF
jgi:hypothetical protein